MKKEIKKCLRLLNGETYGTKEHFAVTDILEKLLKKTDNEQENIKILDIDNKKFPGICDWLTNLSLFEYKDMRLKEHLFTIDNIWQEWNEGLFEISKEDKKQLEKIDKLMRKGGYSYFRFIN